ncbi:MAG: ABC transporter substrate-binding protein, partial [Xanthobacteraceae bacterium]
MTQSGHCRVNFAVMHNTAPSSIDVIKYFNCRSALGAAVRRRDVIALFGVAAAWPLPALAQQSERTRRIGVLSSLAETDVEAQAWDAAFRKRLVELGWIEGRSVRIDYRWAAGSVDRMRLFARELVQLNPDALVSISTPATAALQAETRTIPIVFAWVSDPIGSGFVSSLAHPGGNITGFLNIEASVVGKWLTLMREITPQVSRIGFLYNPQTAPYARYYLDTFRAASSTLAIEAIDAPVHSTEEVEAFMTKLGDEAGAGLFVMSDTSMIVYRKTIYSLAERYRLPTIYPYRVFAAEGGLMSYGVDVADLLQGAASYIDRILRGEKPNELAVQQPTRFELVVNAKTAKKLGLTIPTSMVVA